MTLTTKPRRGERGQAMVELGIVLVLFLMLALGIVEFGRVLMISNVITHAGRHGCRAASVIPPQDRTNGTFTGATVTNLQDIVRAQMANAMGSAAANGFGVAVNQPTVNGMDMVEIRITGSVPYLFSPLLFSTSGSPAGLTIDRTISFRDEGR
jgi:Flp pilus assembly protein TadG